VALKSWAPRKPSDMFLGLVFFFTSSSLDIFLHLFRGIVMVGGALGKSFDDGRRQVDRWQW
jgi:hypothetical protein